ncbi:unnamed protein product [Bursaphelenchus xylophilus]|uniref:(pine wood nematode) hypothetical protein n=1 Tax=Bursaphelenchus xylophilus TaxID=6326 RepID=A0A1I7RZJ5_BURXY|nr:unnamed protein product [Bursaphelenchus xylophilus]CAG9111305.1 unnamed protein product [Bursaphelenchus xylophilus]
MFAAQTQRPWARHYHSSAFWDFNSNAKGGSRLAFPSKHIVSNGLQRKREKRTLMCAKPDKQCPVTLRFFLSLSLLISSIDDPSHEVSDD